EARNVPALSVSVPANAMWWADEPYACVGATSTGPPASACAAAASAIRVHRKASVSSGRCGPCCSTAAVGRPAPVRPRSSAATSHQLSKASLVSAIGSGTEIDDDALELRHRLDGRCAPEPTHPARLAGISSEWGPSVPVGRRLVHVDDT